MNHSANMLRLANMDQSMTEKISDEDLTSERRLSGETLVFKNKNKKKPNAPARTPYKYRPKRERKPKKK